jgi:hypothetical protein
MGCRPVFSVSGDDSWNTLLCIICHLLHLRILGWLPLGEIRGGYKSH